MIFLPLLIFFFKDVVRSSDEVPEFDKYLKKARGHIGRNVEITKMKTIVQKPLMIKINVVVRILLITFPTHFTPSPIILMMTIFLVFVTSQWIGYVLLHPLHCIANLYFFQYFGGVKTHIGIRLYYFPLFVINTLFTSVTPSFFSFFFNSMVHKGSSLLLTNPLLMFRDL